ncbi:MAG TPA: response regulator [Candidatus Saccharimonadales bacterium]|nr:response regulator [Candidatus Saccharimonadales bacterium]
MKALVVDDSSTMRKLLKSILLGAGFEVIEAGDGLEALACLEQGASDLVLLDWNMPKMSGVELLSQLRANHNFDQMRIMMVTTESEQEHIMRALQEGADEYVMKPFTRDAVLDKLQILGCIR